mgnify:FL=1
MTMNNSINKQLRISESEKYLPKQCAEFHERFTGSSEVRLNEQAVTDIVYGIDGKADLCTGDTVNIQFKHRFPKIDGTETLIYVPVKRVWESVMEEDACIYHNADTDFIIRFIPSFGLAHYYAFNIGGSPTAIINVRDLHRAFLRHKTFALKDGCILGDPKKSIDSTYKCLYMPQKLFASIMITDWIYTTFGVNFINKVKDGTENLKDYIL